MKRTSAEVLVFPSSQKMEKTPNQIKSDNAHWIVHNNKHGIEGVLPASDEVLCDICGRGIYKQHLIISGHTVSICSECFPWFDDI